MFALKVTKVKIIVLQICLGIVKHRGLLSYPIPDDGSNSKISITLWALYSAEGQWNLGICQDLPGKN